MRSDFLQKPMRWLGVQNRIYIFYVCVHGANYYHTILVSEGVAGGMHASNDRFCGVDIES